jgi:hypothetical protein
MLLSQSRADWFAPRLTIAQKKIATAMGADENRRKHRIHLPKDWASNAITSIARMSQWENLT